MPIAAGTNYGRGGHEYHRPDGNSTTDTGISHLPTEAKIAFIVSVVMITLLTTFVACCIIMRKRRSVKPAPSDPPDEEQGRPQSARPVGVAIVT
jgi:hypothetical protein